MTVLVCSIFFASGVSALIFETLWFRQAGLAFGNSVWASTLVLSGFMGGLALGNALTARYAHRVRSALRAYAIAEVAIGLTGIGLVYLFPILGVVLAPWLRPLLDHLWILNSVRLCIAFLLLLIPSTAMGATLPLLTKALIGHEPNFGSVLGRLYGWNTLGAVTGALVGETYLIGALGVHGTALTAGALNMGAAVVAAWSSTRLSNQILTPHARRTPIQWTGGRRWLVAAFLSGFCLLALEVVWFRFLLLFVTGTSTALALMLAAVLTGLALGGLAASSWLRAIPDAYRFASPVACSAGLLCVVTYAGFPMMIEPLAPGSITRTLAILQIGVPLMFPVSFLSGIFFTLAGAALRAHLHSETEATGVLALANTTGAALGSLVCGFFLLPVLGMERSFFLITLLYGAIGLLLLLKSPASRGLARMTAAVFLLSTTLFPFGLMGRSLIQIPVTRVQAGASGRVAAVREGLTETLMYFEEQLLGQPVSYRLIANSYSMSETRFWARRYQKLYVYWAMAVHPNLKRALLIAYGAGNTAKAMTDSKNLENIDVVDISRDVLEMSRVVYPDEAANPLHDSRVRVHIDDGRYFLQTTDLHYDLITGEPPPPGIAGVENLYSREYFQLIHDRLTTGGIVTYWLPLPSLTDVSTKAILRAFCDVFEDCSLWNGTINNLMMAGTRNAEAQVPEAQFIRQWNDPLVAAEMVRLGFEQPEQLGALFIGDAEYLKGLIAHSAPLVDNYPKLLEAPFSFQEAADRLFNGLTDVAAARERFRNSPLIKRLWPERLLDASLPYFEFQGMINAFSLGTGFTPSLRIDSVHRLQTQSSLRTMVLWELGSDSDIQRLVSDADPQTLANPVLQYHLGIRFIAERNYEAAVEPLRRAEQVEQLREDAFRLRNYALCMSGSSRTDSC